MKLSEITSYLESIAPPAFQESYDNAGLITGDPSMEITGAVVALDSTEAVVEEAIRNNCNLVIAHHPIVFSGLKKFTGKNYVERTIIKAIKNDIAVYAIHTNLDNVQAGVNAMIAKKLSLKNTRILSPKENLLRKLVTFCPKTEAEKVRNALFEAGAGAIGNYDECSFNAEGTGTFRGNEQTNPYVGEKGKRHLENEERIETIYPQHLEGRILAALRASHPYEEIAYDIYPLLNKWQQVGSGMTGETETVFSLEDFLAHVKRSLAVPVIRYTPVEGKKVKKVAVCGGSGSFLLNDAIRAGADVFITADYKYHQFFDGDGKIVVMDVGHFESEQFTIQLLADFLKQKFPTFAVRQTGVNTNPITYYT